jgi:hypothetical protein
MLLRALTTWLLFGAFALLSPPLRAEPSRPLGELDVAPPDQALAEEQHEPLFPPHLTLPHPELAEQLWRPGDLVEDSYFLRRPWHAGFFFGTMDGDTLTTGVDQASDWFWGLRLGNDFAPHWGWEARSGFFHPNLMYATDPDRRDFARDWFLDLNVLHYPWGDTRLRPFWSIGLGAARFQFADDELRNIDEWVIDLPLAIGLKYHYQPWLTLRGELGDTIILGHQHIYGMNNLSFTVGAEVHWHSFKTRPVRYGY